ncbi:baseplate hub protein [Proteus mirabilis]|uniref:baseplate hub protein n=1 Tax=Proteus mirabilis TaxID=584 RepID=UPI002025498D|nr:hypothetical protein [Proteus mirabilis]MCL8621299.1 hypothetical protein [Proteus mirabilis]MCL8632386.1 hypothetical protein [Proteus mirabilis]HCL6184456.1 hypothetical protein [Proteus mirabilis]HDU8676651.1 hypothetical protein [Proteus mirabilis]HEI9883479.1 hypothetical protein [Proteus mirabilis]
MMDLRRIRVGIEVAERLQWYEGLRIKANGTKYANPLQNECTVSIDGLNAHTRDYLLTETSPYHKSKQTRRLYLEVGRVNTGLFRIFTGDIVSAEIASPPDVTLTIKAKTNNASSGDIVSSSGGAMQKMSEIASSVAKDCKVRLDFQATDKNIANWYFCGSALQQVQRLQEAGNVKAFIDDDTLFVKDDNQALKGRLRILSMKSGMVGIPKATEKGLSVTYLINGASELGGMLRLESKFNSALNGDYIIEQLKFDVASHDDPFFYQATCKRA